MTHGSHGRFAEEELAENLYKQLIVELTEETALSFTPMGVNSFCEAKQGHRACTIYCFAMATGPQFLIRIHERPDLTLWGRTFVQTYAIGAVAAWMAGTPLEIASSRFPFIDRPRRMLSQLRDGVVTIEPVLAKTAIPELKTSESGGCTLWFRTATRSCEVNYYGYNSVPDAHFFWDECFQFGVRLAVEPNSKVRSEDDFLKALHGGDLENWKMYEELDGKRTALLAQLIRRWLSDGAMPSAIQREYPWIILSDLTSWHESGHGIEGEFLASWRIVQEFYHRGIDRDPVMPQILRFINKLCDMGYNRTLRAGTSLFSLLVSRARRHGLRDRMPNESFDPSKHDQCIMFRFGGLPFNPELIEGHLEVTIQLDGREHTQVYPSIELAANIKEQLDKLQSVAIR